LDILTGLWRGQPFNYNGNHYKIKETKFYPPPPPVQKPRIPIWVVGAWPRRKSMKRVLRYDGLLPAMMGDNGKIRMAPPNHDEIRQMKAYIDANRVETTSFDIIIEGRTPGDDREKGMSIVRSWAEVGMTWWLEAMWNDPNLDHILIRIKQGPPRIST